LSSSGKKFVLTDQRTLDRRIDLTLDKGHTVRLFPAQCGQDSLSGIHGVSPAIKMTLFQQGEILPNRNSVTAS
jgi:hypothetical protein